MKKLGVLIVSLMVMAFAGNAYSLQLMWDVGVAGAPAHGDADTLTGIFDQIGFDSQTTTIQYDTNNDGVLSAGDRFIDSGDLRVNGLIAPGIIDMEGLGQPGGYEVTAIWNDVEGYVTSVSGGGSNTQIGVRYDTGTIDFYLDTALDSLFANTGGTTPPSGAGGTGFGNGTLLASLSVLDGIGNTFIDFTGNDLANQGSVELSLKFTYMLEGFWLNSAGIDLLDLNPIEWHFLTTDMNIDTPVQNPGVPEGALFTAYSNQNGSAEVAVVPEPGTILLLGAGLLGTGIYMRRRNRKA